MAKQSRNEEWQKDFDENLHDALFGAWNSDRRAFDPRKFFTDWFRRQGTPLFFLFKKNLSQSNIQFAELLALIRTHTVKRKGKSPVQELQFLTFNEFIEGFSMMVAAFEGGDGDAACKDIVRLYSEPLSRLVLVEPFFGSATVFIPPHLELDYKRVCGESGYIHSCGTNVFTRAIDETDPKDFLDTIEAHVKSHGKPGKKVFFTVYAHEDFTDYDRALASELRGGLDEVKVYVEKYHIGNTPLVLVLKDLQKRLKEHLVIPEPGDFRRQHHKARSQSGLDRSRTMWLIIDRSLSDLPQVPGSNRFLICYNQDVHNGNPFHLFDENKPAWVSHTTISHTLAGAMVNLTRPWMGHDASHPVKLCDPFGGTGTVWFESSKLANCDAESGDLESVSQLLVRDNLFFFAAPTSVLKKTKQGLKRVIKLLDPETPSPKKLNHLQKAAGKDIEWTAELYALLAKQQQGKAGDQVDASVVQAMIKEKSVFRRLLLYVALRTRVRHVNQFARGATDDNTAFIKEAETLVRQFDALIRQRKREHKGTRPLGKLDVFQGSYSDSCGVSRKMMADILRSDRVGTSVHIRDACELQEGVYDVVVTDPPYGFNTKEDQRELAGVYARAIRSLVRSLRDGGQLVICLPERSHTGRKLPAFTTAGVVTQQVLAEAEVLNREVVVAAQALPKPGNLFRPPYYWESERALRRVILHFRFRDKPVRPST